MKRDLAKFIKPYVVDNGKRFRLKDHDPSDTRSVRTKKELKDLLQEGVGRLCKLQERLYAQGQWGVLLVFQAMDAAGKDSAIQHVMSGVNPQGCEVYSFKGPSAEERNHDFLWRTTKKTPERGRIGIFNRSYYEETIVVRVHPELIENSKLPPRLVTRHIWKERFEDINAFERYMSRNGYLIRKFFLNVSKKEQKARFLARLDREEKNWKFGMGDLKERDRWNDYQSAYEETIRHTGTAHAPWIVVPGDNKKFARIVVAAAVIDALESLKLKFPAVSDDQLKDLKRARVMLEAGHRGRGRKSRR
jgi:PPK2 family polyphosphate:nucleotide phosphotransferase